MPATRPAVLIMARAPRRGEVRRALEPLLGLDGCLALEAALLLQAVAWAREVAPGAVHVAHEPPDAAGELRRLLGDRLALFPQNGEGISGRLADGVARVFARWEGPLLIVWPTLARLRRDHASAALEDLEAGCDLVLGPCFDGGLYLLGLRRPLPALFRLPEETWRSREALTVGLAATREAGLELGLLRAERTLQRPADVRAALADPLLPDELGRVLGAGR